MQAHLVLEPLLLSLLGKLMLDLLAALVPIVVVVRAGVRQATILHVDGEPDHLELVPVPDYLIDQLGDVLQMVIFNHFPDLLLHVSLFALLLVVSIEHVLPLFEQLVED